MQSDWNQVSGRCHWLNCICKMLHLRSEVTEVCFIVHHLAYVVTVITHASVNRNAVISSNEIMELTSLFVCYKHILSMSYSSHWHLESRHPRCVCNIKVQCKVVKNTTSLLSDVNRTTCFGVLRGHHQAQ